MARINVTERDISWYTRQGSGSLIVYVPGVSTNGPTDRPVLCDNIHAFERIFGNAIPGNGLNRSYDMAASFIKTGASVLFHRFVGNNAVAPSVKVDTNAKLYLKAKYPGEFLNGCTVTVLDTGVSWSFNIERPDKTSLERFSANYVDPSSEKYYTSENLSDYFTVSVEEGVNVSEIEVVSDTVTISEGTSNISGDSDIVSAITKGDGKSLDVIKDPYLYDFDVAISSGFATTMNSSKVDSVDKVISDAVISRGTAIYLVDGIQGSSPEEFHAYCQQSQFNTSYCAAIGPWCYAKFINTGVTSLLPGSYSFLIAWIKSCSEGVPVWMAPAGVKRASLGSFFVKPQYEIGKAILDQWQLNNEDPTLDAFKINPIMRAKNYGYVVYGNSTLLHNSTEGQTSMLQQIGTRVMANLIKRESFNISLNLQFDQMVGDLYAQFKTLMSVKLDELKYKGAIYDYRVIVDNSLITVGNLNERKVPVTIQISPAPAVENFEITLEITKAGVTFTDSTSSYSSDKVVEN